jgi:hypothetical protein
MSGYTRLCVEGGRQDKREGRVSRTSRVAREGIREEHLEDSRRTARWAVGTCDFDKI